MAELVPGFDRDPDKQGGEPCVAGTRVPVRRIGHLATDEERDGAAIAARVAVSRSDVHRALAYDYDHPDEMARDNRRERVAAHHAAGVEPFEEATERFQGGP